MKKIKVGSKVKVSEQSLTNYPLWGVGETIGIVLSVETKTIKASDLGAVDRIMYQEMYGKAPEYPLMRLMVRFGDGEYVMSQFGVRVVK